MLPKYSVDQLMQARKNGVPDYVVIPMLQKAIAMRDAAAIQKQEQAPAQPPVAQQILQKAQQPAQGIGALQPPAQGMKRGGIAKLARYAEGGDTEPSKPSQNSSPDDWMSKSISEGERMKKYLNDNSGDSNEHLSNALLRAGAAMMANTSPYATVGIGQGLQAGLEGYNESKDRRRKEAKDTLELGNQSIRNQREFSTNSGYSKEIVYTNDGHVGYIDPKTGALKLLTDNSGNPIEAARYDPKMQYNLSNAKAAGAAHTVENPDGSRSVVPGTALEGFSVPMTAPQSGVVSKPKGNNNNPGNVMNRDRLPKTFGSLDEGHAAMVSALHHNLVPGDSIAELGAGYVYGKKPKDLTAAQQQDVDAWANNVSTASGIGLSTPLKPEHIAALAQGVPVAEIGNKPAASLGYPTGAASDRGKIPQGQSTVAKEKAITNAMVEREQAKSDIELNSAEAKAAKSAEGKVQGEATGKAKETLPTKELATDNLNKLADEMLSHEGLTGVVGAPNVRSALPMGTPEADFRAKHKQLAGSVAAEAYKELIGSGSITEAEGRQFAEAKAALSLAQSEDAYRQSLLKFKETTNRLISIARERAGKSPNALASSASKRPPAGSTPDQIADFYNNLK